MPTRVVIVPEEAAARAAVVADAAAILRRGGLVAFPTETVYGLGANALDREAVARIFAVKRRPAWDPLIVHVDGPGMLQTVAAGVPDGMPAVMAAFMPGPLTVLLARHPAIPDEVTAGRATVAVRMPDHPVARALITAAGVPVAAPSANRFGRPSPTRAQHVLDDLGEEIDLLLDAGPTCVGIESTVVDLTCRPPLILRPGAVSREQLEAVLGRVEVFEAPPVEVPPAALPAPGAGIRHYAPRARLVLTDHPREVPTIAAELRREGWRVGVMLAGESAPGSPDLAMSGVEVFAWGPWRDWGALARTLFAGLRHLDARGVDVIVCPLPAPAGLGLALRDRLLKAARR